MKDETTYGLKPERLGRLLALGLEGAHSQEAVPAARTPEALLREMLGNKAPIDPALADSLPSVLKRPCDELLPAARRPLGDLLLDPQTDLSTIETLKDYAKGLVRRRGPENNQAAATVIYYAAIAAALVFHGRSISRHPYVKLREAYAELERKTWIPSDVRNLFKNARSVCQRGMRKTR